LNNMEKWCKVNSWQKIGKFGHPRPTVTKSDQNWTTTTYKAALYT